MSLRIGVDLDGTLADLSAIYHEHEEALFGKPTDGDIVDPAKSERNQPGKEKLKAAKQRSRRQEEVWRVLKRTPDFWTRLKPIEPGVVAELYHQAILHTWEVFFITQRPKSAGASVQKQTQDWLIEQGFPTPSVLTLIGSRGKAAQALDLDFLIDDLPKNCVDVISDSRCRPILVVRHRDEKTVAAARRMNIGIVYSVSEAIELLSGPAPVVRETAVDRILKKLGLAR